jgi:hypothetical protein
MEVGYKLGGEGCVIRKADGACFTLSVKSDISDVYHAWVSAGGVPDPAEIQAPATPEVTAAQAKMALFRAGLLDAVENEVALAYRPVQIYYSSAATWQLDHPYVQGIGAMMGLSSERMSALFQDAAIL